MSRASLDASMRDQQPARTAARDASALVPDAWEQAYLRFETPEEELAKFIARLRRLGAQHWPRESEIVELFCGRGNGLRALAELGFTRIEGIDLSPALAAQYGGPARVIVGDCRELPFPDRSKDVLVVQGGLHHLHELPRDLERTLSEARRVLRDGGRFVAVEPWGTPFLTFVHALSANTLLRKLSNKLDAFEVMYEHERRTYDQWLGRAGEIVGLLERHFETQRLVRRWGKLEFAGVARPAVRSAGA
jgi:SAM-dependent methyltransferase